MGPVSGARSSVRGIADLPGRSMKRMEEVESVVAETRQSVSAVVAEEDSFRKKKAADTVCVLKMELITHVLRFRDVEGRMEPIERAREDSVRDLAQAKREDVLRRTADMSVQNKVRWDHELEVKRLRAEFSAADMVVQKKARRVHESEVKRL